MKKPKHFRLYLAILILFLLSALLLAGSFFDGGGDSYQILFFDVGQGDAAMIRTPEGRTVMIDCGTDLSADDLVAELYARKIDEIDCLILSHAHDDHVGGAAALLESFEVGKILMGDYDPPDGVLWNKILTLADCPIERVGTGYRIILGENADITVLAPDRATENGENNDSLVLMLTIGLKKFLFTGDLESEGEERLLENQPPERLRADVLKVGHHGSDGSTGEEFLRAVNPQIAVISVGADNSYGHPAFGLLNRLEEAGVQVVRTDQVGTVEFRCDGVRLYLKE